MPKNPEIITLKNACELIGISYSYGCHVYHLWCDYGVRILKMRPNSRVRFYTEDIIRMMEKHK